MIKERRQEWTGILASGEPLPALIIGKVRMK
jgi:hypothetical protein